jgi:hypothetical protein
MRIARIFVDDIRQCRNDGEINVPLSQGRITEGDIAGEVGEVVTGKKPGARLMTRSRSSIQPESPCRIRLRFPSNISARWRRASGSRRR